MPLAALPLMAPTVAVAAAPPAVEKPLDVREPPFAEFDFGWMNGNNPQPASLLGMGPVTWSLYVDTYYAWQFNHPQDHTIFPTTTAPRHDEISLNLAHVGIDVTGLDGPIGRLYIQYGSTVETVAGQDTTTSRGFFLTNRLLQNIEQAAAGWHAHWLHGVNAELGIFPSYVGLESYLPEENWSYTHAFLADSTPYYFFGLRGQIFPSARLKIELWAVNGWQTFGEWHEGRAGGYLWNWRPTGALSLVNSIPIRSASTRTTTSRFATSIVRAGTFSSRSPSRSSAISATSTGGTRRRGPWAASRSATGGSGRIVGRAPSAATSSTTRRRRSPRSSPSARPTRGRGRTRCLLPG
jgi:hypothetical protein